MSTPPVAAPVRRSDKDYEYWRWRILLGTMIGYIFFYFVRKSITMAMPGLEEIGITKTTLGLFLTIHGVLYGVARFVNGVWSDRVNPRYFMSYLMLLIEYYYLVHLHSSNVDLKNIDFLHILMAYIDSKLLLEQLIM